MRIRLDKLFLSAGLALAVIATTIPAGAATSTTPASSSEVTGWVINGETVTDITTTDGAKAFGNAITGYSVDGEITNSALSVAGKVTKIEATKENVSEGTDFNPLNEELLSTVNGLTKVAKYTLTAPTVKVTSTYTVPVTAKYTKTVVATDAEDNDVTSATSSNKEEAVNAVNTAATTLESAASTAATNSEKGILAEVTATDITNSAFSDDDVAAAKGDTATEVSVTRNVTFTEVLTYTVSELPSTVTYDYVSLTLEAKSSDAFSAYYEKTNGQAWGTGSVEVVNNTSVMLHVSDFSKVYYIYKGAQSATGALLFAPTEGKDAATNVVVTSGDYTATITNGGSTANDADYTLAKDAPESATVAGYFSIALTKGGVAATNGPSITFKIAVPTDVTASEGKQIKWQVVRVHDYGDGNGNTVELLSATEENGYIVFSSEYFSDFALIYTEVAADTTEEETNNETNNETESATEAGTETTTAGGTSTTSKTSSSGTADNSMMPLFMTTLLLALCAGSLAIYKEKKTN